jgi:crotonobetainyl-CoA:carnitine CoA-transferase CaiB-like acyl-CoA transferase
VTEPVDMPVQDVGNEAAAEPMLAGLRVLDMTQYLSGPTVTRLLAELGAEVIKIEQAPHGDPSRTLAVINDGRSGYFVQQNRGKRSVCLDFDDPRGRQILDDLISRADVFVENYGPGVLERRGFGWADLHARFPRLIMASISGFGRDSAFRDKPAFDLVAQAYSGILALTGPADGPPMPVGASIGDVSAGVHAVAGIGMALYHRERTGRGQYIDISMVDSLFHVHEIAVHSTSLTGGKWRPKRSGHQSSLTAPMGVYRGPEGWIVLHVMQNQWANFCRAMGQPELADDERFATLRNRQLNRAELNPMIEAWMQSLPGDAEVIARLEAERVPCAPVLDPADAAVHPYFESRQMARSVDDPILGKVTIPGNPLRMSEQPEQLELTAPLLGQHNEQVLTELGYSPEAIAELLTSQVMRSAER